jgi:hypothetical protein
MDNMKITVEVSEEYIYEERLTDALKSSIIFDVVQEVKALVKKQTEEEIALVVKDAIQRSVSEVINETVEEFIENGMISVGGQMVKTQDHLLRVFQSHSGWNNPIQQVEKAAQKWALELKAKYDGAFVTQLVQRINLAGMLKPEVATLLLPPENKS